jgi:hypothetical protein
VKYALHATAWLALALITASQGILTYLATGGTVSVVPVLLLNLALWLPWALLSPLIFAAARRLPLQGPGWPRRALLHVILNVALALIAALLYRMLRVAIGVPPRGNYAVMIVSGLNTALLVYWAIIAIAHATAFYRRTEERKRQTAELDRQLAQARLDALRAQIHPHFLFNTLHAIAARVRTDPRGAEDMLGTLGELLRTNLHHGPGHLVPLRDELALIERYLAIQQVRFGGRLRIERHVEDEALAGLVPVLVLQPLVENAIEHGIAHRIAGGALRLDARVRDGTLELLVTDDGSAADSTPQDESRWQVGLTNTRDRLRTLYGDAQRFSVTGDGRKGVVASIHIPHRRSTDT